MTRMHSVGDGVTSTIPAFLTKLWVLVEDETNNDLISWDQSGKSFHMFDQARFSKDVLPYYFKHNNMASFIRQLNMYGFRKVMHTEQGIKHEKEDMEFSHPFFVRGREDLLEHIKRKGAQLKSDDMKVWQDDVNKVLEDVQSMRGKQSTINNNLQSLERENAALWREVALLRQKHVKQEQIVSKLFQFLVSLVRSNRGVNPMKRKLPLMINDSTQRPKPAKVAKFARQLSIEGNLDTAYEVHSPDAPIIVDERDLARPPGELMIQDVTGSSPSHVVVDNLVPPTAIPPTTVIESQADTTAAGSAQSDMEPLLAPGSNVIQATLQLSDLSTVPVSITLVPTATATAADSVTTTTQDVMTTATPVFSTVTTASPIKPEPQQVPTTSTSLTLSDNTLGRITVPEVVKREQMSDYVDGIQNELESLKDLLSGGQYSLDADTLMGLFTPDAPLPATPDNSLAIQMGILEDITDVSLRSLLKLVDNASDEFGTGKTAHPLETASTSGNILGNELIEYSGQDDFSSLFDLGDINSQSMLESQPLGFSDLTTGAGPSSELNTPEFDIASPLARRRKKTPSKIATTSTEEVD